jgi:hypothetical protein
VVSFKSQSRSGRCGDEKRSLPLPGIEPQSFNPYLTQHTDRYHGSNSTYILQTVLVWWEGREESSGETRARHADVCKIKLKLRVVKGKNRCEVEKSVTICNINSQINFNI